MNGFIKKWVRKNKISIIVTLILSCILSFGLGYIVRPYSAFGGEDLLPIITISYWVFKYFEDKENEEE